MRRSTLLWMILSAIALQNVIYWEALRIKPAGDDWTPPLSDINRAGREGVLALFTRNSWAHPMWRPLQSLAFVGLDKISRPNLVPLIHVLNHACMAFAIVTLALWLRAMKLPAYAVAVGLVFFVVSPVNVAPVASIDGFGSVLMPALAWMLCLILYVMREKPAMALIIASAVFVLAHGVKEYLFAFAPMACVVTLLWYRPPMKWTVITAAALGGLITGLMFVRRYLDLVPVPGMAAESGEQLNPSKFDPLRAALNHAMAAFAALYPGNTVNLFSPPPPAARVVSAGLLALGIFAAIAGGCRAVYSRRQGVESIPPDAGRWLLMLALMLPATIFPASLVMRISEMYLLGLSMCVAMLAAWAAVGIRTYLATQKRRVGAATVAAVCVLPLPIISTAAKIHEQRLSGDEAAAVMRFLDGVLPRDRTGVKVLVLFDAREAAARGYYSVYRVPTIGLIGDSRSLDFLRPGADDVLTAAYSEARGTTPTVEPYDVAVKWSVATRTGIVLKP